MEFSELSNRAMGCAIEVHRKLGPGLLESTCEQCVAHELSLRAGPDKQEPETLWRKNRKIHRQDTMTVFSPWDGHRCVCPSCARLGLDHDMDRFGFVNHGNPVRSGINRGGVMINLDKSIAGNRKRPVQHCCTGPSL